MMADILPTELPRPVLPRPVPGGRWRRVEAARFRALVAVAPMPPSLVNHEQGYTEWSTATSPYAARVLQSVNAGFYEWVAEGVR